MVRTERDFPVFRILSVAAAVVAAGALGAAGSTFTPDMWVYQLKIDNTPHTMKIGFNEDGFACTGTTYGILGCHGHDDPVNVTFQSEIDYEKGSPASTTTSGGKMPMAMR